MQLLTSLRTALSLLDVRRRRLLTATIPMSVAITVVELTGLALLFPFIQEVVRADAQESTEFGGALGRIQSLFDIADRDTLMQVTGALVFGCLIARSVLGAMLTWWQTRLVAQAEASLSAHLFRSYLFEDYVFHTLNHSSSLIRNLQGSVREFFQRLVMGFITLSSESFVMVGIVLTLIVIDPVVAFGGSVALATAGVLFVRVVGARSRRLGSQDLEMSKADLKLSQEGLNAIKIIQVYNRQSNIADRYIAQREEHAAVRAKVLFSSAMTRYYLEISVIVVVVLVTLITLRRQEDSSDAVGLLGVFVAGMFRLLPSLQRVLGAVQGVHLGQAALEIVSTEVKRARGVDLSHASAATTIEFQHSLEIHHLSYTYPGRAVRVIDDMSFSLRKGQSIGIVGSSGAGKSTLVDIVLGLLEPTKGEVRIDGYPLRTPGDIEGWRQLVGYVPQEVTLVDESLRRNVAVGLEDAVIDDERVRRALDRAQISDLIDLLPAGLDSVVGERGVQLSGGQRQRVGIARALYVEPQVLILDEATSSLDAATESALTQTIETLRGQLTMIIVAHRLSTIRGCDELLFLDGGRIAGIGSFDDLIAENPSFRILVSAGTSEPSPMATPGASARVALPRRGDLS